MKCLCGHSRRHFPYSETGHQVDNSVSTIQKLNTLYYYPELSDLILHVGEKVFHTHKLILSISSDVFKTMLTSPKWPEAYTSHITLQEEPECVEVFEDFLRYLYTGKINLSHVSVLSVLTLADKYNIGDLSQVCIDYMCDHYVAPQDECHVISWLKYASMCGHRQLEHICEEYIICNFQYVIETEDFLSISEEMLMRFLFSADIVLLDEISLFRQVVKWISKQSSTTNKSDEKTVNNLDAVVKKLCKLIHFQMIPLSELMALKSDPVMNTFGDVIFPYFNSAIEYHKTSQDNFSVHSKTTESPSAMLDGKIEMSASCGIQDERKPLSHHQLSGNHPRIYTCDSWCTEMIVTDLQNVSPGEIQGAFFSTPLTGSEVDDSACWDWHVDLYPKGVAFKKCLMIGLFENHEIDEVMYETIRLTVSVASSISETRHVKISVLVYGEQDGMEYIAKVITRTCFFNKDCILYNINNIVDYAKIYQGRSPYLVGTNKDTLKFMINIRPTTVQDYTKQL